MQTLDRLRICDLAVRCRLGVTVAERAKPQEVLVSVTLHADLSRAGRTDRLGDSIDYKALKLKILALGERRSFKLIERLAQGVADVALADRRVQQVDVVVSKPGALRFARCSEVEISRSQASGRRPSAGKGRRLEKGTV